MSIPTSPARAVFYYYLIVLLLGLWSTDQARSSERNERHETRHGHWSSYELLMANAAPLDAGMNFILADDDTNETTTTFVQSIFAAIEPDGLETLYPESLSYDDLLSTGTDGYIGGVPDAGAYDPKQEYNDKVLTPFQDALTEFPAPIAEGICIDDITLRANWRMGESWSRKGGTLL